MKRFVKSVATVLLLVITASLASAQPVAPPKKVSSIPLTKLLKRTAEKLSKAEDLKLLLEIADEATRRETEVVTKAIERGFREKAQLVVGAEGVDVVVEQTTSNWRGSVTQRLTMPCTATLAMDLDKLLENTTYNPSTKTIELYLPLLSIIAVESHNQKCAAEPEYTGGCWAWYDSGLADKMEVTLLRSEWSTLAREKINPNADHLRKVAQNEATRVLKGLIEPINPDVKIVVNP